MITVLVLCYGDYPDLVIRCLASIVSTLDPLVVKEVRIGLNEASPAARRFTIISAHDMPVPVTTYREVNDRNVGKYPMMRRMLYDAESPIQTENVMWFDDDSYVTGDTSWWGTVHSLLHGYEMIGSKYKLLRGYQGGQVAAIKDQPWHTGKPIKPQPDFCTGGWWAANYWLLKTHNYPFPEIKHNGGDVMLGQLCHQQSVRTRHFNTGVAINADAQGRESKAERRGIVTRPVWEDYDPAVPPDLSHQEFEVVKATYAK